MSKEEIEQPTFSNYTLSILGALGSLLLFLFIKPISFTNRAGYPLRLDYQLVQKLRTKIL